MVNIFSSTPIQSSYIYRYAQKNFRCDNGHSNKNMATYKDYLKYFKNDALGLIFDIYDYFKCKNFQGHQDFRISEIFRSLYLHPKV